MVISTPIKSEAYPEGRVVAVIPQTAKSEIRISLVERRGKRLVEIKVFEDYGRLTGRGPTSRAVVLDIEQIAQLQAALDAAEQIGSEPHNA